MIITNTYLEVLKRWVSAHITELKEAAFELDQKKKLVKQETEDLFELFETAPNYLIENDASWHVQ